MELYHGHKKRFGRSPRNKLMMPVLKLMAMVTNKIMNAESPRVESLSCSSGTCSKIITAKAVLTYSFIIQLLPVPSIILLSRNVPTRYVYFFKFINNATFNSKSQS